MDDLISRQAAIDALGEKPLAWTEGEYELGLQNQWQSDVDALNDLPSAQPDLIRRSEVIEAIDDIDWYHQNASKEMVSGASNEHEAWYRAEDVYKALESVPSAQPEIIRCRDCRYYQDNNGGYPHMNCKWDANETPDADDFCSGAERREDERPES